MIGYLGRNGSAKVRFCRNKLLFGIWERFNTTKIDVNIALKLLISLTLLTRSACPQKIKTVKNFPRL